VLAALRDVPEGPTPREFHASVRVPDLAAAARFYTWLLGVSPKEWTHRYVTFVSEALRTNFVLLVSDGKELHHDTLYHLGVDVGTRAAVIDAQHRAVAAGISPSEAGAHHLAGHPAARAVAHRSGRQPGRDLRAPHRAELAEMPADKEPWTLVSGEAA
jgi:arsenate reductase